MEDIVVESYKRQIKECNVKANAIKVGGLDILVKYLDDHSVDTTRLKSFFKQIQNSETLDDLNQLTMDELLSITDDINSQVTRQLVSQAEIGDFILRRSNIIAHEKSLSGNVEKDNRYLVVGTNLAEVIMKSGIAEGIKLCIKQYCNQKLYKANYRMKLVEKEKKLGIYQDDNDILKKKQDIKRRFDMEVKSKLSENNDNYINDEKNKVLEGIFGHKVQFYVGEFEDAKKDYYIKLNERLEEINSSNG